MWHGSRSVWKRKCDMLLEVASHVIRLFVNSPSHLWKFRQSHLTAQHTSSWLEMRWCHRYHARSGPDNRWRDRGGGEPRLSSIIILLFHLASLKLPMAPSTVSHWSSSVTSQCNTTDPRAACVWMSGWWQTVTGTPRLSNTIKKEVQCSYYTCCSGRI